MLLLIELFEKFTLIGREVFLRDEIVDCCIHALENFILDLWLQNIGVIDALFSEVDHLIHQSTIVVVRQIALQDLSQNLIFVLLVSRM